MATERPSSLGRLLAQAADAHELAARALRAAAEELGGEVDPLLPHDAWEVAPPNETPAQRTARHRRWTTRARRGEIEGAVHRGRSWWARRSAVEAYIAGGRRPVEPDLVADFFPKARAR